MANIHFLRKLAQDDLWDTLFFSTGEVPQKTKNPNYIILKTRPFEMKIYSNRRITLNDTKYKSIHEVKLAIQRACR